MSLFIGNSQIPIVYQKLSSVNLKSQQAIQKMNLKIILVVLVLFADAARPKRSRFFKFHGHKVNEASTSAPNDETTGVSKRNRALMLMIANVRSQERRVALMSAMTKTTEASAQKLRMVSSLNSF